MRGKAIVIALLIDFFATSVIAAPRKIALIDGEGITYQTIKEDCIGFPKPCPRPNLEVLESILPSQSMFPGVETFQFKVGKRDESSGAFPGFVDVSNVKPDIVLVHWSSFAAVEGAACYPKGEKSAVECAEQVVEFLANIYRSHHVDIVVYSRKSGICEADFNDSLRRMVFRVMENDQRLHNFARDIGFIAMPADTEMRNFNTAATQRRLLRLIKALTTDVFPSWSGKRSQGLCILSSLE